MLVIISNSLTQKEIDDFVNLHMDQHNFELEHYKKRANYFHNTYKEYKEKRKNYDNIHRYQIYHYSAHYHTPPGDNDPIDLSRYNLYTQRGNELAIIRRRQKHKRVVDNSNKPIQNQQKASKTHNSIQDEIQLQFLQQLSKQEETNILNNLQF